MTVESINKDNWAWATQRFRSGRALRRGHRSAWNRSGYKELERHYPGKTLPMIVLSVLLFFCDRARAYVVEGSPGETGEALPKIPRRYNGSFHFSDDNLMAAFSVNKTRKLEKKPSKAWR